MRTLGSLGLGSVYLVYVVHRFYDPPHYCPQTQHHKTALEIRSEAAEQINGDRVYIQDSTPIFLL